MSAPDKIWAKNEGDNYGSWYIINEHIGVAQSYTRSDLIPAMLAEARREALREVRDNISGSCWAMPSNGGTRSYNRGVQDSLSVIDALLDAEAPAQPTPDAGQVWQPIETAPRDGTIIMGGWNFGGWSYCIMRWNGCGWTKRFDATPCYDPTHWMPLPAAPAGIAQEGE